MKPAEKVPDCFVVVWRARRTEMAFKGSLQTPAWQGLRSQVAQSARRRFSNPQLTRPGENILIGAVDLMGALRNRDSQFMAAVPEIRLAGDLRNLPNGFVELPKCAKSVPKVGNC